MPKFAAGVAKFQKEVYPKRKDLFQSLAEGQSPEALFITCSDSRIDPNLVTQTEPGELFICRNAGNIVPPHTNHTGAMTASIEFALGALKVPHVIVCGHSNCGAMKGALARETLGALPHVAEWLTYVRAAVEIVDSQGSALSEEERLRRLTEENVILQLDHLRTHPYVARALAARQVELHGWVYDIASGGVSVFEPRSRSFLPAEEHYREAAAALAENAGHTHSHA